MFAFAITLLLFLAEGGHAKGGGFYDTYLNYPGFEVWKFVNLAIFLAIAIYIGGKKLTPAFKAKRDAIRAELIKAEEEKQAALSQLTTVEAKLSSLDTERRTIIENARAEADAEKQRLAEQADSEVAKLGQQTGGEISRLTKQAVVELRRFSAEESVRLAEANLRAQMDPSKDEKLVQAGIASMGGLNS